MLINPVSDLLKPEIIIVPDRGLYRVPFLSLLDKKGKYLTETFKIHVVPSLTTLKLIQDSPTDYHTIMIILHVHLPPQFTYELFHIYFTPKRNFSTNRKNLTALALPSMDGKYLEKGTFRKRSSNRRNLKTLALSFSGGTKH